MSTHRVTVEFTLELENEPSAQQLAVQLIRAQAASSASGVVSDLGSPEVASHELGQELKVAASMIAAEILRLGAMQLPQWVAVSRLRVGNDQLPE